MRSKIIMMGIFVMLFEHMSAQKYSPGKIVTNKGDTIACMIKVGKWDLSPNKIVTELNDDTKRYWPTEIASFQVGNRIFVSARVKLDKSNHIDGTLDVNDSRPKFENDSIFAELISGGKKNLYRYKSPSYKEHFLIADQGGSLESLIFKRFTVWEERMDKNIRHIAYNDDYKDQLEKHFADCPDLKNKIVVTGYDAGQLTSLFRLYYNCSNQKDTALK